MKVLTNHVNETVNCHFKAHLINASKSNCNRLRCMENIILLYFGILKYFYHDSVSKNSYSTITNIIYV